MALYFTSDPHYGHVNVIRLCNRPFKDVGEMNQKMIDNWNVVVRQEDTVYILGDFSMSSSYIHTIAPRLLGTKVLVAGNHDASHSCNKKSNSPEKHARQLEEYGKYFNRIVEEDSIEINGVTFKMNHFPFWNPEYKDARYQQLRPRDDGTPLLCGHVHTSWHVTKTTKKTVQINVGVDMNDFRPISTDKVLELYNQTLQERK